MVSPEGASSGRRVHGRRVPGDISVVGFDNIRLANSASLALTTVSQDSRELAHLALDIAIGHAEETEGDAVEIVVAPSLVVRESTGSPEVNGSGRSASNA